MRLLRKIDVAQIEQAQIERVNQLIGKKKFAPYRINNCYPIAMDGTQKIAFSTLCSDELRQRKRTSTQNSEASDPQYQYDVYVLEANLSFQNGIVIPLMSESLDYQQGDTQRRKQAFRWVNQIRYEYGPNGKNHITVHLVLCQEQWQAVDEKAQILTKTSQHAWLSSRPLNRHNVHERCNLAGRDRWGIESCILVEKHHGYAYEHTFAKDCNAMRGYHYLRRIAHLLNTLARYSTALAGLFQEMGIQAFIRFVRTTCTGPWLEDAGDIEQRRRKPFRLRLV